MTHFQKRQSRGVGCLWQIHYVVYFPQNYINKKMIKRFFIVDPFAFPA